MLTSQIGNKIHVCNLREQIRWGFLPQYDKRDDCTYVRPLCQALNTTLLEWTKRVWNSFKGVPFLVYNSEGTIVPVSCLTQLSNVYFSFINYSLKVVFEQVVYFNLGNTLLATIFNFGTKTKIFFKKESQSFVLILKAHALQGFCNIYNLSESPLRSKWTASCFMYIHLYLHCSGFLIHKL